MNRAKLNKCVLRIKEGDEQAFAEMYEATRRGVFSYVYSILRNFAVAEEIMQDTYINVKLKMYLQGRHKFYGVVVADSQKSVLQLSA